MGPALRGVPPGAPPSRPGFTVETCADILFAVADGLAARALAVPDARVVEHERRRSQLGTVTLALILACLERDNEAGGQTLEEAVAAMPRGNLRRRR